MFDQEPPARDRGLFFYWCAKHGAKRLNSAEIAGGDLRTPRLQVHLHWWILSNKIGLGLGPQHEVAGLTTRLGAWRRRNIAVLDLFPVLRIQRFAIAQHGEIGRAHV